jgi:predicted  nucleic acid-binding Zn-ribbon protein
VGTIQQEDFMAKHTEPVENELFEIAAELTAMGDMVSVLLSDYEDMETETPGGIKLLLTDIRKRIDRARLALNGSSGRSDAGG